MTEKPRTVPIEYRALRGREGGTFERLLCQLLIVANNSEPLKKIQKMCEASYRAYSMMPHNPDNKINMDEVEVIYKVVISLRNATHYSLSSNREFISITWVFPPLKENFERFIQPWLTNPLLQYYPYIGPYNPYNGPGEYEQKFEEVAKSLDPYMYFFTITAGMERYGLKLSELGFDRLVSQFLVWAIPKVQEWYLEITKLVDESVFDSILRTMYGAKEEQEKE